MLAFLYERSKIKKAAGYKNAAIGAGYICESATVNAHVINIYQ
ncbi:MAG: hypothetical protein AAFW70_00450 [Cyanobacteria bacterium J06635_10]